MYQRMLYIGLAAAAGLIVLILGIGAFYEYQIKPNQVLATVNGNEIKREDYWRYQSVALYDQARTYEEYALQVTGQQQTQFLTYAAQLDAAREDVWGSTEVSEATISQMIEDRLYVAAADAEGIDLSDERLQDFALNSFAPADQPLVTPYPSPTMSPERAAWATETAEAIQTQQAAATTTPPALATPGATPVGTPGATPVGTSAATPVAAGSATPVGTPSEAELANVRSNAEIEFELFQEEVLDDANMTTEQYMDMFVRPQLAREAINATIMAGVQQYAPQVEVQHILVGTQDLANQTYERVTNGEDFSEVAETISTDSITAPTGGELGWVTEGQLPDSVAEVAFSTEPGTIAQPVESPFGWHIIKVLDKSDDRPLTEAQYTAATDEAMSTWLEQQRETYNVSSDHYNPTPEPTAETFVPPADAPTPIVATPVAAPDLSATPVAGPVFAPQGSPAASPVASPQATPAGSSTASPAS
jgi:parvulin-like peptidyl-prolyl isomerase